MKKVRLESGLNLSINDGVMDNMELLDDLVEVDEGNAFAISRIVRRVLDDENRKNCMTTSGWTVSRRFPE